MVMPELASREGGAMLRRASGLNILILPLLVVSALLSLTIIGIPLAMALFAGALILVAIGDK